MPDDDIDHAAEALASSRERPLERPRPPGTSPTFATWAGISLIVFGGVVAGLAGTRFIAALGSIVVVLGVVVAGIGVVAAGVRLGNEWTDYDRAMRER